MRSFTLIDVPQRSPEWYAARAGRLTASRVADIFETRRDGKEAAARRNMRLQLVLERLTGKCQEKTWQSDAMRQGIDREADAVGAYEALTGQLLAGSGFLRHDDLMIGCSLDGHVGDYQRLVEIKCPLPATHLQYWRTSTVPEEYQRQIVHQLWITGAEFCDFFSFCPDFPEAMQSKLVTIWRDETAVTAHELQVRLFLGEVDKEHDDLRRQLEAVPA